MPHIECPKCKHEIPLKECGDACPECGWNLQTQIEQTLKTGSSEVPGSDHEDDSDFLVPGVNQPADSEKTLTDTAGSIDSPTLEPPTRPKIEKTASEIEQTLPHGQSKTASPKDAESEDADLLKTMASARPGSDANKTSRDNDPTIILPGDGKAPPTVQRSVKTVIPPRSISRKSEPGKLQDYKLGKRIGSGSFGVVYRALQVPLDRTVALKVLTAESESTDRQEQVKTEFLREAQFTGRLEHPNIVPIHDIGLTEDRSGDPNRPFYVMKEIHGVSWMQKILKLSRAENLEIFKRVVDAIGFAHDKNVLHCDLKPENVMLGEFGEVLVVDWGQAIDLSQPESIRPGGTPAYISPEMAQFWCDIYLEKMESSPAQELVGQRSDVYLLGAILFEIITEGLARNADDGETQYDVIRRACDNDIIEHDEFLNDELMQIARRALRLTASDHIESIDELQAAIKKFETRALSIELRERADQLLASAKTDGSYDEFQKARFGYEEALGNWTENVGAKQGLLDARLSCAELALNDQNFDLGIEMLADPETEAELRVKEQLVAGRKRRDRRKQLVRWLALGLVASIIVGLGLNAFMINLNLKSAKLRDEALQDKANIEQEIEPLRKEVVANQLKIQQFPIKLQQEQDRFDRELAKNRELLNTQLAEEKRRYGDQLNHEKQQFETELADEKIKFNNQVQQFDAQRDNMNAEIGELSGQVSTLHESSKLLRFKSSISDIRQELQNGNFRKARSLLDVLTPKDTWEWSRLNLLAHREIESFYPDQQIVAVCASHDGTRLGLAYPDRVEVRETLNFAAPPMVVPIPNVQSVALSPGGKRLALGRPSSSSLEPGVIQIVDVSDARNPKLVQSLDGQSTSITHMEFSPSSNRFLSVGQPSKLRKSSSSGLEEELMIWSDDWKRIDVALADNLGASPKFQRASFSHDGSKILTTNPMGLGREQFVHLFSEDSGNYGWIAKSPVAFLNCAEFRDDVGLEIVACARSPKSGSYALVSWEPGRSTVVENQEESGNFVSVDNGDPTTSLSSLAKLDNKILNVWRSENWFVTCGEDRQTTLWQLDSGSLTRFRGHSRNVDFCSLLPGQNGDDHVLISVASGPNPEILKTDLATYESESDSISIGTAARDDQPSPTALFRSTLTGRIAFANDQGLAAVAIAPHDQDNQLTSQIENAAAIQWEVSAWKKQVLTDEFLFAQSRRDEIFQFDRRTGELVSVLTELMKGRDELTEITTFKVANDGRTAVIRTNENVPRFEVWDLKKQYKINTIDYGQANIFGSETDKELLSVEISPDGKWIVAGKLGLFAWSTETGLRQPLNQPAADVARTSISSIQFLPGTSQFLASWKGRIDLFDLNEQKLARRFNVPQLSYSKTEPNIVDATVKQGRVLVLARWTGNSESESGIALVELGSETPIKLFPQAKFASFSRAKPSEILLVSEVANVSQLKRYESKSDRTIPFDIQFDTESKERFSSLQNITEFADGLIVTQSVTRNPINPVRGNWNTVSCNQDLTPGRLRVFAKPKIDFCAIADEIAITLDQGNLRFWKVTSRGVVPNGVFVKNCRRCELANNERLLAVVPFAAGQVLIVDPIDRKTLATIPAEGQVTAIRWSHDSSELAVGNDSGVVQLWRQGNSADEFLLATAIPVGTDERNSVTELALSRDGTAVLSIWGDTGAARISHLVNNNWTSFLLQPEDGKKIVHGDISSNGQRAVTGSELGRLTIWNTENLNDDGKNDQRNQTLGFEREVVSLQDKHQSAIRFVKFLPNSNGQPELVSAEEDAGDNSFLIWNTRPQQSD